MRVVIDTNCFLAIIPKISPYRPVFDAYRHKQFELTVSTEILNEYSEVFGRRMTPFIADNLLELIDKQDNTIKADIYYRWVLITNELTTHAFPTINCISLPEFLNVLLTKST